MSLVATLLNTNAASVLQYLIYDNFISKNVLCNTNNMLFQVKLKKL